MKPARDGAGSDAASTGHEARDISQSAQESRRQLQQTASPVSSLFFAKYTDYSCAWNDFLQTGSQRRLQHACAMVAGLLDPEARVPHADSQLMT